MTKPPRAMPEVVGFRRSAALPGIEIVDAQHSPREWRVACPVFAVVVFRTWRGPVRVGGRTHGAEPGKVFCNVPGEAMVAQPEGGRPGSFNVIELEPELLNEWLAEQQGSALRPYWSEVTKSISGDLSAKFRRFFDSFEPEASPLQLQSEMSLLAEAMVRELIAGASDRRPLEGPPIRGTARMRECLNEEGFDLDLETLARKVGLSRFQALRAFKRRYGLPPHAYQLCVRLGQARRLLSEGATPVDVALRCGFVDQSHFSRHFKRAFGVTPAQYARGQALDGRRSSGVYLASHAVDVDVTGIVSRSDRRGV